MLGVAAATEQLLMEVVLCTLCERLRVRVYSCAPGRDQSPSQAKQAQVSESNPIKSNQSRVVRNKTKP